MKIYGMLGTSNGRRFSQITAARVLIFRRFKFETDSVNEKGYAKETEKYKIMKEKGAVPMHNKLKDYFPQIRTREEVLADIHRNPVCSYQFASFPQEIKEEILDFCTGARGVKMTYDSFFKEILSPEVHPQRLEELLSLLLEQEVHIRQVLPNDSVRIAEEGTLLVTDIVVELEDGSMANIEIQKIGYAFPGQRGACYSADLLLRQYKRIKGMKNKKFNYRDMKTVYTIVFFEKSTVEFHEANTQYIHRARQVFDTGLKLDMLQDYILIPLDIYKECKQNENIETKLDAWLSFLSDDRPERIMEIIERYPVFREMYGEVYAICRNVEGVMDMFSEELLELDRNTVQYMIEEQQEQLDALKKEVEELSEKAKREEEETKRAKIEARAAKREAQREIERLKKEAAEKAVLEKQVEDLKRMVADLLDNRR